MAKLNLDLSKVVAQTGGLADAVPEGVYVAKIVSAEPKPTKDGTGGYLELALQIQEGPQAGKTLVDRLNIHNQKPDTVRIALSQLKGIMEMGGHPNPNMLVDTDDMLKLRPLSVTVITEKSVSGDKEYTNSRIKKYKAHDGNSTAVPPVIASAPTAQGNPFAAAPAAPAAAPAAPVAAAAPATFPWGAPR